MLMCGFCIVATVVILLLLLLVFKRCDGDLLLMWKEKFGHGIDSLSGQVIWITGASSGIGEALACRLAAAGCKLILSSRREEDLNHVKAACLMMAQDKLGEEDILVIPFDVTHFESHAPAVQKAIDYFKKIDVLINNAGTTQRGKWLNVELDVDRKMFELNVLGPVYLTQLVVPHMIARGQGQVVVTSSLAGKTGCPGSRSYSGSKFALHGYFDSLRIEIGHQNIGVTMVCAGPVFSNILVNAFTEKSGELLDERMDLSESRMPTDRCAYLYGVAVANKLYEAWICQQPFLILTYICQIIPDLGKWILLKMGTKTIARLRDGK